MIKPERPHLWIGTEIVTREGKRGFILSILVPRGFANGMTSPQISYNDDFHTEPWNVSWEDIYPIDTPWTAFEFNGRSIRDIEDWINCLNFFKPDRPYDCCRCNFQFEDPPEYAEHPGLRQNPDDTLRKFFIKNRMDLI